MREQRCFGAKNRRQRHELLACADAVSSRQPRAHGPASAHPEQGRTDPDALRFHIARSPEWGGAHVVIGRTLSATAFSSLRALYLPGAAVIHCGSLLFSFSTLKGGFITSN